MPLILTREDEKRWIEPNLMHDHINELIEPYPESDKIAYTVLQNVNSAKNNRHLAKSLDKVVYPELSSL